LRRTGGVFNHVGREFRAFRDLHENGEQSTYVSWFCNVRFDSRNRFGDGFVCDGWEGVEEPVLLGYENPDVQEHLLSATEHWIDIFGIDGIRPDVVREASAGAGTQSTLVEL
jgi:glycosidase